MINPISFGKIYISKAPVVEVWGKKKTEMNFVEYEPAKDFSYVADEAQIWQKGSVFGGFITSISHDMDFHRGRTRTRYFGLEDKDGHMQAVCEIKPHTKRRAFELGAIEVNPKNMHGSDEQKYKKLGSSAFREIIKLAKKEKARYIGLIDLSGGFWSKVPYMREYDNNFSDMTLFSEDYDKCIKKLDETI